MSRTIKRVKKSLDNIQTSLLSLKTLRRQMATLRDETIPNMQQEILVALKTVDPENNGVVFINEDGQEEAGFYQQNTPSQYWNQAKIVAYLKKNKQLWMACSSRVFDAAKWEAEIANGNIPAKVADSFKEVGNPPSPFVRFGKPKKDSVR